MQHRTDQAARAEHEQRMTVRGRLHERLRGDVAAGARPVIDDELLAKSLRQPLPDQACDDVRRATGRNADDDPHRLRGIGLRDRGAGTCKDKNEREGSQDCLSKQHGRVLR